MSSYNDRYGDRRDDRYDDRPDDRDPVPPAGGAADRARARVAAPAILMLLNAVLGILLWGGLTAVSVAAPTWQIDAMRKFLAGQPETPERKDAENKLQEAEDQIKANPASAQASAAAQGGVLMLLNAIALFGALRMRSLGSYGWGLAASILSLVPIATGCVCTGMPFGLWGLIVLLNAEVKAGFTAARAARSSPRDAY